MDRQVEQPPARPAGWYPDPTTESWWDGVAWTTLTRPAGSPVTDGPVVDPAGVPSAGWYPTPGMERWWDGARWTPSTRTDSATPSGAATDRRRPTAVLVALGALAALLVAAGAVLVLGGDTDTTSSETAAATPTSTPTGDPTADMTTTTIATTTTTTPSSTTTTLPDPDSTFDAALAAWSTVAFAADASAGPVRTPGAPIGVVVDGGTPVVYRWNGAEWLVDAPVASSHAPYADVRSIQFADVTGDRIDEIVVGFTSASTAYGDVLMWSPNGYGSARFDLSIVGLGLGAAPQNLALGAGGLVARQPTCQPTCSDTAYLELAIRWTGSRFEAVDVKCADYRNRGFVFPMVRCDRGEFVENLQTALRRFGYLDGSADGYFGPGTESAVRVLQSDAGWAVTGEVEQYQYIEIIEAYYDSGYDY